MKTSILLVLWLWSAARVIYAYPAYDDPVTASPPLIRRGEFLCTVDLVRNATCDAYDKVTTQPFLLHANPACRGRVSMAVLDFYGAVKGIQFDRSGGIFLGEVELLRTTTPEPSPQGITWHVEKDVSDYLSYILDEKPKSGALGIANIVDKTYTGVIYVNATLSFYGRPFLALSNLVEGIRPSTTPAFQASSVLPSFLRGRAVDSLNPSKIEKELYRSQNESAGLLVEKGAYPPLVLPAIFPVVNASTGRWSGITSLSGDDEISFPLPPWPQPNIARVYLDVVASPHGCEEFFYTNTPSDAQEPDGTSCGGGVYREIQVWVDGQLAGVIYPAVVLYTGGVNPFLWRPLTGIESFDIPAYRFDLTPFAGIFNSAMSSNAVGLTSVALQDVKNDTGLYERAPSTIMGTSTARPNISVRVNGNNKKGIWSVTSALLLYPDWTIEASTPLFGRINSLTDSGPQVSVAKTRDIEGVEEGSNSTTYKTVGYHKFSVSGTLSYPDSSQTITTTVSAYLSAWNENSLVGNHTQRTRGAMADHTTVERHESKGTFREQHRLQNRYPYFIQSFFATDNSSLELRATVDIGLERSFDDESDARRPFSSSWTNRIKSRAVYNRSLDHYQTYTTLGESIETFQIFNSWQGPAPCYDRVLAARKGNIYLNRSTYTCIFPPGLSFCGDRICNQLGVPLDDSEPDRLKASKVTIGPKPTFKIAEDQERMNKEAGTLIDDSPSTLMPQLSIEAKTVLEDTSDPQKLTLAALHDRVRLAKQGVKK
ncbi:peptide-n4-(n-acetyl-beta-glucosaminyl)asparagine amidase a [Nannochloropsis gaditana]|uniref:Peptide-n4-(N-acetyl-beta-glucosaminyl)asparagine amidase a n=1 Tax=Nannochloropsis gaditana TaxID=72520 RepID=W7U8E0_9STRA|nr:peptide-n4-(n-acetyl-beta-glucosaminyl)asparagine amidase a [Nannochloropsis gaditana]